MRVGIGAGIVLGLIILYFLPSFSSPFSLVQVLLDYPLAFAALGLAGFFRGRPIVRILHLEAKREQELKAFGRIRQRIWITIIQEFDALIGVAVGILGRFTSHFVSGVLFFPMFAPAGVSPIVYSAVYNGAYLGPEFVISSIIMFLMVKRNMLQLFL